MSALGISPIVLEMVGLALGFCAVLFALDALAEKLWRRPPRDTHSVAAE